MCVEHFWEARYRSGAFAMTSTAMSWTCCHENDAEQPGRSANDQIFQVQISSESCSPVALHSRRSDCGPLGTSRIDHSTDLQRPFTAEFAHSYGTKIHWHRHPHPPHNFHWLAGLSSTRSAAAARTTMSHRIVECARSTGKGAQRSSRMSVLRFRKEAKRKRDVGVTRAGHSHVPSKIVHC